MVIVEPKNIRIEEISIENYKGIDSLKLSFPKPTNEPDIFAMGSENGVGKTSIIECCSLLLLAVQKNKLRGFFELRDFPDDIRNLVINASSVKAKISGSLIINNS